jgi:predicted AlkP superfamily pyrophosphatase or phosphodiesterase
VNHRRFLLTVLLLFVPAVPAALASASEYVIQISVDALGARYLEALMDANQLPNFKRLQTEGATTNNARTDDDYTITLPNHTCMITGRGVVGPDGHDWTVNITPGKEQTLHNNKGSYVASVFDVAHDHGLRTALYAGKEKFAIYAQSYNAENGAVDAVGGHSRGKIDVFEAKSDSAQLIRDFVAAMKDKPFQYSFIHFHDPDTAGHAYGWGSKPYNDAVRTVDRCLGPIFDLVEQDPRFHGRTTITLTADHGGKDFEHGDIHEPFVYTIPVYVWGCDAARGKDLYALNRATRQDPGAGRLLYTDPRQPIRNGDMANLGMRLLGLPAVPGSTINVKQDLNPSDQAAKKKAA